MTDTDIRHLSTTLAIIAMPLLFALAISVHRRLRRGDSQTGATFPG